jgi:hypothetical protein
MVMGTATDNADLTPLEGRTPSFADLSDWPEQSLLPPLDRDGVDESTLTPLQRTWRRDGVVVLKGFLPPERVDAYVRVREKIENPIGWACPVPYLHVPEIRDLCLYEPLYRVMKELIGDEMGLHLNLCGWVSTERNWHQDDYLNPDFVNSWYAAVWMALDTIHPDCGPFQYVPGSHRWPLTRSKRVFEFLRPEEQGHNWPLTAERFVNQAFDRQIAETGAQVVPFHAEKGDLLIWHGRLAHRGSEPRDRTLQRRTLIAHYTALSRRKDMPNVERTPEGVPYFTTVKLPLDWTP